MAQDNTTTTLSGLFKEVYANELRNLIPENVMLQKMIPFVESSKEIGNKYHQPVQVSHEHGITYASADSGAFALNAAIASQFKDAQVDGSQMLLRSSMSYEAAARASNDKKAFVKATSLMVTNMVNSMAKRLEIGILYGRSGIGKKLSQTGAGTTRAYTLDTASWAAGIWAGSESMAVDFYNVSTKLNTNADVVVTSVDLDLRIVNVSGNAADLTAIDAVALADIYFKGAFGNEFAGLDKIITNSGVLFNIDASLFALWKGNTYSAGSAALSLTKILSAVAKGVERGLDEAVVCLVSPKTWSNLASDQASLRRYDDSYRAGGLDNGAEKFTFHGQNGKIEVLSSIYVKEGEAFIFPPKRLKRIGALDISFKMPGRQQQEDFFIELANSAGYELRSYTDQSLFCDSPAKLIKITLIVNS